MELGEVYHARENGTLGFLGALPISDGGKRYRLRKALEEIGKEFDTIAAERNKIIKEASPDGEGITPAHPRFAAVLNEIESFMGTTSDLKLEPVFTESEISSMTISVAQENSIRILGMVIPEPEPVAEPEPKPTDQRKKKR